jgi:hypothetical protein
MMGICSVSEVIRGFSKVDYVGQIIHYFSSYEFELIVMDCSPCRRKLFLLDVDGMDVSRLLLS